MVGSRKSFPLRISQELYDQLKTWAEHEMRSVNGQIEFVLREAVKRHAGREFDDDDAAVEP